MLKYRFPDFYKATSSLFMTYRRAYTKEITKEETRILKERLKEAFKNAKIEIPQYEEINNAVKKAFKK